MGRSFHLICIDVYIVSYFKVRKNFKILKYFNVDFIFETVLTFIVSQHIFRAGKYVFIFVW